MLFRLVPKSSTLNDLERPKRTLLQKRCFFGAHCTNLNEARPILSATKCKPMTLSSENVRCMRIFAGIPLVGGSGHQMRVGLSTNLNAVRLHVHRKYALLMCCSRRIGLYILYSSCSFSSCTVRCIDGLLTTPLQRSLVHDRATSYV